MEPKATTDLKPASLTSKPGGLLDSSYIVAGGKAQASPRSRPKTPYPSSLVYWNQAAGSANRANDALDRLRALPDRFKIVSGDLPMTIGDLTQQLTSNHIERLIVAGGDGTVSMAANAIMACPKINRPALVILPVGTGNDFSRNLDLDIAHGLDAIIADQLERKTVDLIKITSSSLPIPTYCVNVANAGIASQVTEQIDKKSKRFWGALSYLTTALQSDISIKSINIELIIDEHEAVAVSAMNLLIANGRTAGGGVVVAPMANIQDGQLDLVIIKELDLFQTVGLLTAAFTGNFEQSEGLIHRPCQSVLIKGLHPDIPFSVDGEVGLHAPALFEVVPSALPILVPVAHSK